MNIGYWGESEACRYLARCGYQILERNFRCRIGELDIVAQKDSTLCFVEVKTRKSLCCGMPCEAVDEKKRRHILRAAQYYLVSHCIMDMEVRIDLIELLLVGNKPYIRHTENIII